MRPNILGSSSSRRKHPEEGAPDHHEVEVPDDKIGVVNINIDRGHGGETPVSPPMMNMERKRPRKASEGGNGYCRATWCPAS